ncbi:MAG: hypothetical protein FWD60_06455 [Candidatus Azobacteroides sp.]|nr:hypothetical protein [Candidatus Azobacteroides sp.]
MKNPILLFLVISIPLILFSCRDKDSQIITEAETLVFSNPDSTLVLLENIKKPKSLNNELYAHFLLLKTQAKNKINADISNDTLLYVAINYFKKKNDYDRVAHAYFYENRVYQARDLNKEAIKSCHLAKEYAEKAYDFNLLGLIYHDFGFLYKNQLNFQEAINNFKKGIFYFQKSGNKEYATYMYKRIGDVYLVSRQQGYTDSALINYQKALEYAEQENNQNEIYRIFQSISLNFCENNQLEKAKTFIKKAIECSGEQHENFNDYMSLSEIHIGLNEPDSALLYIEKAYSVNTKPSLSEIYIYKKMLYRIDKMKRDYQPALSDLEECLVYIDSTYINMMSQNILEIQKKYETESLENEKQELLIQRLHLFIFYMSLFILLSVAVGFYIYKTQKQKAKLLQIQRTVGFLEEMLQSKNIKENKLKELLIEKLDLAKKITQMNIEPNQNNNYFIKQFHKIFGYNIAETLNWDKLYPLFNALYNNIVDKLKESYPTLTEKELQFCCLIKAEFRHDEIAFLLSYEYNSIRTIKMRLRMKMGFDSYDDFNQFLINL